VGISLFVLKPDEPSLILREARPTGVLLRT
jgi:hypothetical protein